MSDVAKNFGPRQRRTRFIKEYLLDHNATRAAKAAGYSEKTANEQGARLLANANIREEITKQDAAINAKLEVSVERVKKELARLAFFDPRKFFQDDGSLRAISDLDEDTAAVIAGLDVTELFDGSGESRSQVGYLKRLKLADRGMNLERLGRHLKMFTDKTEVAGEGGTPLGIQVTFVESDGK